MTSVKSQTPPFTSRLLWVPYRLRKFLDRYGGQRTSENGRLGGSKITSPGCLPEKGMETLRSCSGNVGLHEAAASIGLTSARQLQEAARGRTPDSNVAEDEVVGLWSTTHQTQQCQDQQPP